MAVHVQYQPFILVIIIIIIIIIIITTTTTTTTTTATTTSSSSSSSSSSSVLYLTEDLNPVLDLNLTVVNPRMTRIWRVAALPDRGAFIINHVRSNRTDQVWRVNVTGQVIQLVYQCVRCNLQGLLMLNVIYMLYTVMVH